MGYNDTVNFTAGVLGALGGMIVATVISGFFYELPFLWVSIGAFNMICITWCAQKSAKGITIGGVVACAVLSLFSIFLTKYFSLVYDSVRHSIGESLIGILIGTLVWLFEQLDNQYYMAEFVSEMIRVYIFGTIGIVAIALYKGMQIKREY